MHLQIGRVMDLILLHVCVCVHVCKCVCASETFKTDREKNKITSSTGTEKTHPPTYIRI